MYSRGEAYNIPNEEVDGMDIEAVREAGLRAINHARAGKGPYVLGMQTYRYRGHSMSDPAKYRTREEVAKVRAERDPIDRVRQALLDGGHASEDDLKAVDAEIKAIVTEAAEFAQQSPEPNASELYTDVLADLSLSA
jgi:pyruvate dehydrogenase E1 component alpha subunit